MIYWTSFIACQKCFFSRKQRYQISQIKLNFDHFSLKIAQDSIVESFIKIKTENL